LQDRVQSYRKMNVKGFRWISASNNFGPQGLYLYMLSQLMWNPDLDLAKELDLYYENYYGPAAKPMKAYHETWMDAFEQSDIGGGQLGGGINSGGRGMHMICTPALMAKLGEYIQEAEQLVKGDKLYERRFRGTWIGYEFSRRVSELLAAKAEDGVLTETGRGGYYLKSAKAAEKWEDLKRWIAQVNQGDAHFGIKIEDGQPQDAALIYMV